MIFCISQNTKVQIEKKKFTKGHRRERELKEIAQSIISLCENSCNFFSAAKISCGEILFYKCHLNTKPN